MSAAGTDLQRVLATFLPRYRHEHALHPRQRQVCAHIRDCRTAALGGLVEGCERCEYQSPPRFNSCRDRHCPKCQGRAAAQWGERQRERLLPVTYYHLVFTVPDALNPWGQLCPRVLYTQLFASAWATLSAFAANPRRLGGQLGATLVLHTWGRTLIQHVHLHCLVPGGVLTAAGEWCPAKGAYLFPVRALSRRFRGHFVAGLRRRQRAGELERLDPEAVDGMLDALMATDWVVYAKSCLGHTESVVAYLARYTHRTALSDQRLIGIEGERVGLRYTDHRDGQRKALWLDATELIRRFLLHVLPKGLMRIRHYGFLANRCRSERLRQIRDALARSAEDPGNHPGGDDAGQSPQAPSPASQAPRCPRCRSGRLRLIVLAPVRIEGG